MGWSRRGGRAAGSDQQAGGNDSNPQARIGNARRLSVMSSVPGGRYDPRRKGRSRDRKGRKQTTIRNCKERERKRNGPPIQSVMQLIRARLKRLCSRPAQRNSTSDRDMSCQV